MTTTFEPAVFGNDYEKQPEEQEVNTTPATQGFIADTPVKAEWCIGKLKGLFAQRDAIQGHYVEMVALAEQYRDAEIMKLQSDISFFENQLRFYGENNLPEGKKTVNLINGALKFKQNPVKFIHDDNVLMDIAIKNNWNELIEIKKSFKWGEYKKRLTIDENTGEVMDTVTGEVMPIQAERGELTFRVEVK